MHNPLSFSKGAYHVTSHCPDEEIEHDKHRSLSYVPSQSLSLTKVTPSDIHHFIFELQIPTPIALWNEKIHPATREASQMLPCLKRDVLSLPPVTFCPSGLHLYHHLLSIPCPNYTSQYCPQLFQSSLCILLILSQLFCFLFFNDIFFSHNLIFYRDLWPLI